MNGSSFFLGTVMCLILPASGSWPAAVQASDAVTNLLPNPSFEAESAGGIQGWKSRAWHGEPNGRWTVERPGRTGKQCVSLRSEQGSDAAWTTSVSVKPNSFYRLSGWIRTEGVRGAVGALLNIQNLQHVRTPPVTGTKSWTRVATVFRNGEETLLEVNCLFGGWGESTGQAWYDDVAMEWLAEASDPRQAMVTIESDAPKVPHSPMLRGGFIEHFHRQIYGGLFEPGSRLSDEMGFRRDVIEALKELRLSIVRWPGGCFASGYHWKDGVGKNRKPTYDKVWGVEDPNSFGTDEFVAWCRKVGCEPYICTNAGDGTSEEMKAWVAYCNRPGGRNALIREAEQPIKPLNVRHWSIGNENWGAHEIGAKTPAEWGPLVLQSAEMMRSVDPDLKLVAAATADPAWTLPLLKSAGKNLDYVAIHEYWLPCWGENLTPDYLSCIMESEGPETTITRVLGLLDEAGCRGRIQIAFDEWNLRSWHHPGFPRKQPGNNDPAVAELIRARDKSDIASQYTMADALFAASFLNACLRHAEDVGMANIAPIVNTRGPLYVHPGGVVKRTTFHVLAMYGNLLHERVAGVEVASAPLKQASRSIATLDAVATCDASGRKWRIVLVNRHPSDSLLCLMRLGGRILDGTYRATILAGDSPEAYNDIDRPSRVVPQTVHIVSQDGRIALPAHSVTIIEVE